MGAIATLVIRKFKSVDFIRKQRDRISKDIANMDFKLIKEYLAKKKISRRPPWKNVNLNSIVGPVSRFSQIPRPHKRLLSAIRIFLYIYIINAMRL